jgi:hypothetical protein
LFHNHSTTQPAQQRDTSAFGVSQATVTTHHNTDKSSEALAIHHRADRVRVRVRIQLRRMLFLSLSLIVVSFAHTHTHTYTHYLALHALLRRTTLFVLIVPFLLRLLVCVPFYRLGLVERGLCVISLLGNSLVPLSHLVVHLVAFKHDRLLVVSDPKEPCLSYLRTGCNIACPLSSISFGKRSNKYVPGTSTHTHTHTHTHVSVVFITIRCLSWLLLSLPPTL